LETLFHLPYNLAPYIPEKKTAFQTVLVSFSILEQLPEDFFKH